ncbi:hypothetical protein TEA_002457 [Camellia sinensis var. sinensis]|uniref:3'-5' exonuclease domain-containing protein n=1 Tax=Camellia sinensis var. sinensis TaxID=542762 RepID=A0A4S4DBH1_CAMSN|nr:hypothetical protein TEA_002457 [Camellia sinensis var. sinensis]
MAFATTPHKTYIPLPSDSGGKHPDNEALLSLVPIHIVTHASQLPTEFLYPSPERQLVIGFDCEGVDLCRYGTLCIMQLAFPDAIYLVDAIQGGKVLMNACKPALESSYITKVIHDCKRDSEALYFQFGIKLHNVVDTQIISHVSPRLYGKWAVLPGLVMQACNSSEGIKAAEVDCISYLEKKEVRTRLREDISYLLFQAVHEVDNLLCVFQRWSMRIDLAFTEIVYALKDPTFWMYRPLSELMVRAAADDVRFLPYIYHKMMEKLNERSLWKLAVRGALYSRCFCISDNEYVDWPSIPSIPGVLLSSQLQRVELKSSIEALLISKEWVEKKCKFTQLGLKFFNIKLLKNARMGLRWWLNEVEAYRDPLLYEDERVL